MKKTLYTTVRHTLAVITTFFVSGLFTILPITLTLSLFYIAWHFISKLTAPLHDIIVPPFLRTIPYFEVIFVVLIIIAIGALMDLVLARSLVHSAEKLVAKLPLINPIYSGLKQLTSAFSMQGKASFKHVVLVEFPRKGVYSVGFLSSDFPMELSPDKTTKFYNVFIPATPNPLHGAYVIFPENEVIITELSRQEAMSMIMSGGIIQPERYQQK
jgi:uncharacterized membrane protein